LASEAYARLAYAGAAKYADVAARSALGPYYGAYKLGSLAVSRLDQAVLGNRRTGAKAAYYQLVTGDVPGLVRNVLGIGRKAPHTPLNEHGLSNNAKAFWEGRATPADLQGLLSPDPFGIPWLLSSWDVLGSAKRLQKRFIASAQGEGRDAAIDRAQQFLRDPESTHAFNDAQLAIFAPLSRMLAGR